DHLNTARPAQFLLRDESETEKRVAERFALFALCECLLDVVARDLVRAHEDLVDGVGAIVRARRENVSTFEVDDLDDPVVLEADRSRELFPPQLDESLDQIDLADF